MGYGTTEPSQSRDEYNSSIDLSDEDSIVPKGSLDPVYEAKARLLNRAVCIIMGPACFWNIILSFVLVSSFGPTADLLT
jgi:hypothetical protein